MNTKEKYFNISLLRTMATIIIVVFHILLKTSPGDGRTYFPFYIGVPVFLFVSGFLYARKPITDIKQFYKNNILKILVPTIVFAALYFSAVGVYSLFTNAPFMDLVRDSTGGGGDHSFDRSPVVYTSNYLVLSNTSTSTQHMG